MIEGISISEISLLSGDMIMYKWAPWNFFKYGHARAFTDMGMTINHTPLSLNQWILFALYFYLIFLFQLLPSAMFWYVLFLFENCHSFSVRTVFGNKTNLSACSYLDAKDFFQLPVRQCLPFCVLWLNSHTCSGVEEAFSRVLQLHPARECPCMACHHPIQGLNNCFISYSPS